MSQKFHINNNGEAKPCYARKRPCKYGGSTGKEMHFETKEAAEDFYEKKMKTKYENQFTKRKNTKTALDTLRNNGVRVKSIQNVPDYNFKRAKDYSVSNVDVIEDKLPNNFIKDLKQGKMKHFFEKERNYKK